MNSRVVRILPVGHLFDRIIKGYGQPALPPLRGLLPDSWIRLPERDYGSSNEQLALLCIETSAQVFVGHPEISRTFPMLKSLRQRITRLREIVADRRQAARFKAQRPARLLFNVSVVRDDTSASSIQTIPLVGFTRDISETGLALVVPSLRSGDRYLVDEGCTLRIVLLDLPAGEVEIYCTPVRYLELDQPGSGHLIGVQITEMSDDDRARLLQFLKTLH